MFLEEEGRPPSAFPDPFLAAANELFLFVTEVSPEFQSLSSLLLDPCLDGTL